MSPAYVPEPLLTMTAHSSLHLRVVNQQHQFQRATPGRIMCGCHASGYPCQCPDDLSYGGDWIKQMPAQTVYFAQGARALGGGMLRQCSRYRDWTAGEVDSGMPWH